MLACLIGPMLGIGLAFFLQYLDTTVKTREDVEQAMKLPVLGYVPALHEELNGAKGGERSSYDLVAVERSRSALAEAFRSLRTSLSFSTGSSGVRSFLVTSPSPLEGKSLVSINLAITFAQAGKRVLLVDAVRHVTLLHFCWLSLFVRSPAQGYPVSRPNSGRHPPSVISNVRAMPWRAHKHLFSHGLHHVLPSQRSRCNAR